MCPSWRSTVPVDAEGQELPPDSVDAAAAEGQDASDVKYAAVVVEPEAIPQNKTIRTLRLLSGVATVVAGLATLLVMAMIYRPLSAGSLVAFSRWQAFLRRLLHSVVY